MQEKDEKKDVTKSKTNSMAATGFKRQGKYFYCPYEECRKKFTESGNLKTHIRTHVHNLMITALVDWRKTVSLRLSWMWEEFCHKGTSKKSLPNAYRR